MWYVWFYRMLLLTLTVFCLGAGFFIVYREGQFAGLIAALVGLNVIASSSGLFFINIKEHKKDSFVKIFSVIFFTMNIVGNIMIRGFTTNPPYVIMLNVMLLLIYIVTVRQVIISKPKTQVESQVENQEEEHD